MMRAQFAEQVAGGAGCSLVDVWVELPPEFVKGLGYLA
jgi:hypothetical protein